MEALMPAPVTSIDVESFLYSPPEDSSSSGSEDLPIIGTSALEQILCPSSPSSISSSSASCDSPLSSIRDMERMSPDSTMEYSRIQSGEAFQNGYNVTQSSPPIPQQPDSTTADLNNYDSDEFNSDDSCDSSFETHQNPRPNNIHANNSNQQNNSFSQQQSQNVPNRPVHSHPPHGHNIQPTPSPQNLDLIYNSTTYNNVSQDQKDAINNNNNNNNVPIKKKKKKKSKRAGDVLLTCNLCDYSTRYKEHLTSHMHTHDPSRNYMCSDCGQTFKWSHSLKRHQNSAHKMDPDHRYTCKFCMKTFSRKDHLSIHENLHTSSGVTYPCTECGATFKNKKTLTGHIKTHTSQKAFKCGQCDSEFTRRASLNRHIKAAHEGQTIKCPDCNLVFSYRSTLEDHKKAAHNEGKREFECELCGQDFAVKAYLSKHMVTCRNRKVGKTYSCRLCTKKGFLSKLRLAEHEKRKHPTIVVTSVVNGGNSSVSSSLSPSSHTQSESLQTTDSQTNSHHVPSSPMTYRSSNSSVSPNSTISVSSYSHSPVLSNVPSSPITSSQRQWEGNTYFNPQNVLGQHHLMPPSQYPMHPQIPPSYGTSQHLNNYTPYSGIHPNISTVGPQCYPAAPASSFQQQSLQTSGSLNHTSHYTGPSLTSLNSENVSSVGMQHHQGEENVGSLMRLVYSCSDNSMEPNYSFSNPESHSNFSNMDLQSQPNSKSSLQVQNNQFTPSHLQTLNLNNACVMPEITQLDNDLSKGGCFDWDSFSKIDCKN